MNDIDIHYVSRTCDRCNEVNVLHSSITDLQSAMFNADYTIHSFTCAYCLQDNVYLVYYK